MSARLFTPGPTDIPDDVRAALARPSIHHRTPQFLALAKDVHDGLERLMDSPKPVAVLAASGTGGMEAVVTNLLAPGERAAVVVAGKFGERWRDLLQMCGNPFTELTAEWGTTVTPEQLDGALAKHADTRLVLATQCETSTGTLADVRALAQVARRHGAMIAVDAISSLAAHELPLAAWDLDAVVGASQKALMLPPGGAFVALSQRAWGAAKANTRPRYYFDLRPYEALEPGNSPFTPPVGIYFGLHASLARIEGEGLATFQARHARLALATRAGAMALGCTLFSKSPANVVTALIPPSGVAARDVMKELESRYNVRIALGQGAWKDKMIRIAHMGVTSESDVLMVLASLGATLAAKGHACDPSAGVAAAQTALGAPSPGVVHAS
jgi:aspartate aminotransferase-like enzyme